MLIDSLALSYFNLKKSDLIQLIERFGSAEAILKSSLYELTANGGLSERIAERILQSREQNLARAAIELVALKDYCIEVIAFGTPQYPTLLAECCDAPLVIYVMGNNNLIVEDELWISVVGTKNCTDIGKMITETFISDIADYNKDSVIVSSLSEGIETTVHRTALKVGLRAVAVMTCSLDKVTHEHSRDLASEILKNGGTLISEYPLNSKFYHNCYNERNRIVAGLSHATVIAEAPLESNTLQTANIASSYNRSVFAFPGRVTDYSYKGNNQLIKSDRAEMITAFDDVKNSMELTRQIAKKDRAIPTMSPKEQLIYDCLRDGAAHSDDEIMEKTALDITQFNAMISLMELNDLVVALRGRMFIKK